MSSPSLRLKSEPSKDGAGYRLHAKVTTVHFHILPHLSLITVLHFNAA
jgi:hypothetical protein